MSFYKKSSYGEEIASLWGVIAQTYGEIDGVGYYWSVYLGQGCRVLGPMKKLGGFRVL